VCVLEYTIKMRWKKNVCSLSCHNRLFVKNKLVLILDGAVKTEEESTVFFQKSFCILLPKKKNPSFLAALTSLWEGKGVDKWKNPCERAPLSSNTLAFPQPWQIKEYREVVCVARVMWQGSGKHIDWTTNLKLVSHNLNFWYDIFEMATSTSPSFVFVCSTGTENVLCLITFSSIGIDSIMA